jgi:hypothetical protein
MSDEMDQPIDLDRELMSLVAREEMLAFFDFVLALGGDRDGGPTVEGLCKISRPKERRSRVTYLSLLFVVDAADVSAQQALAARFGAIDWDAARAEGVDGVLPVPHRDAGAGLFLKEVDVFLDGSRVADAAFVRETLLPSIVRATGIRPGELTVWQSSPAPAATPSSNSDAASESLVDRLRRLLGLGAR